ncbi:unnamed protein product [Meloidogyne enterolobii]|uniref:Uncharacterized protein n=1 Tax=Meloidogyne enterolobii TaxID=390850 RepID=A0ACB1ARQ7_MELEN
MGFYTSSIYLKFFKTFSACKCFPNNLKVSRGQPLNLLSPGLPLHCDYINCSTQISLENPISTTDHVESLQIHVNSFYNNFNYFVKPLNLQIPLCDEKQDLIM